MRRSFPRMKSRLLPLLAATAALLLPSCVATRFYNSIDEGGQIVDRFRIDWEKPDSFIYRKDANPGFKFVRHNGEVIVPETIMTDGGSVPRILWAREGYSPWTYGPAYVIHDWIYEAHRRNVPAAKKADGTPITYTKEQADWIMAEVIKAQMQKETVEQNRQPQGSHEAQNPATQQALVGGEKGIHRARMFSIYAAVSRFGHKAWTDEAHPVSEDILGHPVRLVNSIVDQTIDALPLSPVLDSLKSQVTPVPGKPPQEGTPYHAVPNQPTPAQAKPKSTKRR